MYTLADYLAQPGIPFQEFIDELACQVKVALNEHFSVHGAFRLTLERVIRPRDLAIADFQWHQAELNRWMQYADELPVDDELARCAVRLLADRDRKYFEGYLPL
jgi:N-acetyl-beta-hexosaminidase